MISISASTDADAKAIVYEDVAAPAMRASKQAQSRARIAVDASQPGELSFPELVAPDAFDAQPRADPERLVGDALHLRAPRRGRKACRAGSARSVPPRWRMWHRTSIASTNARSG